MISKEEFISYCDAIIPAEEKQKYKKAIIRRILLMTIIPIIELIIALVFFKRFFWVGCAVIVISLIVIYLSTGYRWSELKNEYGPKAIDYLLKDFQYTYENNAYIGRSVFVQSGIKGQFDNYSGEDLITIRIPNDDGTPSNVDIAFSDLYVTRTETETITVTDSDGHTHTEERERTVVVYKGVFGYIAFPFEFKCNLALNIKQTGCKKIQLEDVKFNKAFKTYTDDQLEALIVLTPKLIEKLRKYEQRVPGFFVSMQRPGRMYFGMKNNLFELTKFKKPSGKAFSRFYDDINDLLLIVDEIKTNNRVFKM